eukprot:330224_1
MQKLVILFSVLSTVIEIVMECIIWYIVFKYHLKEEFETLRNQGCFEPKGMYDVAKMESEMENIQVMSLVQIIMQCFILFVTLSTSKCCPACLSKYGEAPEVLHQFMKVVMDFILHAMNFFLIYGLFTRFNKDDKDSGFLCYYDQK